MTPRVIIGKGDAYRHRRTVYLDDGTWVSMITVWQTDPPPDTARVGTTRYRGRPLLATPPVVSEHPHGRLGARGCPRCLPGELARDANPPRDSGEWYLPEYPDFDYSTGFQPRRR